MSAAATAAGYLYASGRLRGRGVREQEEAGHQQQPKPKNAEKPVIRKPVRVAAMPEQGEPQAEPRAKRVPRIEYRTRRWRPESDTHE